MTAHTHGHHREKNNKEKKMSQNTQLDVFLDAFGGVNKTITIEPIVNGATQESGTSLWWAMRALWLHGSDYWDDSHVHVGVVRDLISKGADVNAVGQMNGTEYTPLWFAAWTVYFDGEGGLETAKLLLEENARVNVVGEHQLGLECTPLNVAVVAVKNADTDEATELTRLLLEKGADPNAVGVMRHDVPSNEEAWPSGEDIKCAALWNLSKAVNIGKKGAADLVKLLIEKGANVVDVVGTEKDDDGIEKKSTPLRWLAEAKRDSREGGHELVDLLVSKGATLLPSEHDEWDTFLPRPVSEEVRYLRQLEDADIPDGFLCPIVRDVMNDPHVASDGHTYERSAIERWFLVHDTSPMTREGATGTALTPNHGLRSMICALAVKLRSEALFEVLPTRE